VQGKVKGWQAVRICGIPRHPCAGGGPQVRNPLNVIGVVVGQQDLRQGPAPLAQGRQNRGRLGHVDDGGIAAGGIVDQEGVVIRQARDGYKVKRHGVSPLSAYIFAATIVLEGSDRNAS
jgi:hypothetical protein